MIIMMIEIAVDCSIRMDWVSQFRMTVTESPDATLIAQLHNYDTTQYNTMLIPNPTY